MASWSAGSQIFEEIATVIRANVSDYEARCDVYREIIPIFEDNGAELHDIYESVDEAFDEVWSEMYPQDGDDGY